MGESVIPSAELVDCAPAAMNAIRVLTVADLLSGSDRFGVLGAMSVVLAGSVPRRPPTFVESSAVLRDLRRRLSDYFGQTNVRYVDRHLLALCDALVVGQGTVVVQGRGEQGLLRESAVEFLAQNRTPDGMDRRDGELFAIRRPIHRVVEERCLLLKRPWFRNFGHWLVDQAAALSYLAHTGNLGTRHIVVGKVQSAKMREVMMQTVAAILPDAVVHEHPDEEVWRFRRLDYVMPVHTPPLFKLPAALDYLRADLRAVPVPEVKRSRRIFVTRTGQFRRLVNESEIIALCAAHGFEVMQPESLPIAEQAALFANAEAIIGVKGAAMTNVLFSEAHCTLMALSPGDFIDPFFWDIASTRDIAYGEVFGELRSERAAGLNDFCVEPSAVDAMIQAMLPVTRSPSTAPTS
jgi:hypothetical protein